MRIEKYVRDIKRVASVSEEVLNRLTGGQSNVDEELKLIIIDIIHDAQEEYRKDIADKMENALAPLYRGMIEKMVPSNHLEMPRMSPGRIPSQNTNQGNSIL